MLGSFRLRLWALLQLFRSLCEKGAVMDDRRRMLADLVPEILSGHCGGYGIYGCVLGAEPGAVVDTGGDLSGHALRHLAAYREMDRAIHSFLDAYLVVKQAHLDRCDRCKAAASAMVRGELRDHEFGKALMRGFTAEQRAELAARVLTRSPEHWRRRIRARIKPPFDPKLH